MKKIILASIVTFFVTVIICNAITNNYIYRITYNAIDNVIYTISDHKMMFPQY